ncbi:hypothetical protein ADZ36_14890 [Streptomyces fradiae]|uniref:Uncharacterized protein n=1 Tax=Streptomyces fradiae TaxID=1906 RepID=A0ACC4WAX1_STRFR|nr:hypothetical protein ADZ36_14890 [Streptomyces fradiae]
MVWKTSAPWRKRIRPVGQGEHRSAGPVGLLVASLAELSGLVLLHSDRDFGPFARHTGQRTVMVTDRSRS